MGTNVFAERADLTIAIGSGVVMTATGRSLDANGHRVVFCDVSASRRAELRAGGKETIEPEALGVQDFDAYLISVPSVTFGGGAESDREATYFGIALRRSINGFLRSRTTRRRRIRRRLVPSRWRR